MVDYNLANTAGAVIGFEARGPILGFNIPEAVLLANTGRSAYNSLQLSLVKRMSRGVQFNLAYTFSRSEDTSSTDPGSTAGGGKPDVPNAGLLGAGQPARSRRQLRAVGLRSAAPLQRQLGVGPAGQRRARRLPLLRLRADAVRVALFDLFGGAGAGQRQPVHAIWSADRAASTASAFGRPSLCGSLDELRQPGDDPTEAAFNKSVLCSPSTAAGGYPGNQGFGNLGRNVLRGFWQRRVDLSLAKSIPLRRRPQLRAAVGHLQRPQHRELRAAEQRHRIGVHRLRQDHRLGRRPPRHAARRARADSSGCLSSSQEIRGRRSGVVLSSLLSS